MKMRIKNLFQVIMIMFLVACGHSQRMTNSEVISVANKAAEAAGYKLNDYLDPKAHFEFTRKDRTWFVSYEGKLAAPGNHFSVTVDDQTGKTSVMAGE